MHSSSLLSNTAQPSRRRTDDRSLNFTVSRRDFGRNDDCPQEGVWNEEQEGMGT